MIPIRRSHDTKENPKLKIEDALPNETNIKWLKRVGGKSGVLLIGGCTLAHFRIRVAQCHLRQDLLPSFWSYAGILQEDGMVASAPLDQQGETSEVPLNNGVRECPVAVFDDPLLYPNIALIKFTDQPVHEYIQRVRDQRAIVDLPSLIVTWLGFVWGVGSQGNPLLTSQSLPGAAFAEAVYGLIGIDLTPGLSSTTSCPEAIWQSAKWWHKFYTEAAESGIETAATSMVPSGSCCVRQPAAAALDPMGLSGTGKGRTSSGKKTRRDSASRDKRVV